MFNRTDPGFIVKVLLFLPIELDESGAHGINLRWILRIGVIAAILTRLLFLLWSRRGSPQRVLPYRLLCLTAIVAVLTTASIFEFGHLEFDLKGYKYMIVRLFCTGLAVSWCLSQIFNLCIPVPGPFTAKVTSLWKIYHVFSGSYDKAILELHQKYGKPLYIGQRST